MLTLQSHNQGDGARNFEPYPADKLKQQYKIPKSIILVIFRRTNQFGSQIRALLKILMCTTVGIMKTAIMQV